MPLNLKETPISNDNFKVKNVIKIRNKKKKYNLSRENKKNKIIKKCNNKVTETKNVYKDIYLKIDEMNNNGKKTIVYFVDNFYPCVDGVLMVMENYVNFMSKFYNIVVCAPKHKNEEIKFEKYFVLYSNSIYLKTQGYDLGFPQFDNKFQKFLSLLKIDLIHVHAPFNMGTYGLKLAKKRKIPCFASFHSQYKQDFYKAVKNNAIANMLTKIILYIYNNATLDITMNSFSKHLMQEYGVKNEIAIVPNATNLVAKEFDKPYENKILEKYNINNEMFNIIFIGRLVKVKNVYFILEVLNALKQKTDKFNFIFVGDGPELKNMKGLCKKYNIEDNVKFTGKVLVEDEKAILIKNSKLLFFPSDYDTDGIVKMECACYNVPTMCLRGTGAGSNIVDKKNGFLVNLNIEECAENLKFLSENVKNCEKVGKNANLDIYKTWDDVCGELKILYEKYFNKTFKN